MSCKNVEDSYNLLHSSINKIKGIFMSLDRSKMRLESAKAVLYQEAHALRKMADALTENKNFGAAFIKTLHLFEATAKKGRVIVVGMGKSGHVGRKIAATLASMGTPSFFVHPSEASHGDLGMITTKDVVVVISNSGESKELFDVLDYCNRFGIQLIAITRQAKSTMAKKSQVVLEMPDVPEVCPIGKAPTTSTTMTLALGDALGVVMAERLGLTKDLYKFWHPGGKLGSSLVFAKTLLNKKNKFIKVKESDTVEKVSTLYFKDPAPIVVLNAKGVISGIVNPINFVRAEADKAIKVIMEDVLIFADTAPIHEIHQKMLEAKSDYCAIVNTANKPQGILYLHEILTNG